MEIISALQALWSPVKDHCAFSCIVCKRWEYSFMKLIVGKDTRSQTFPPLIYSLNVSEIMSFHLFYLLWNHPNHIGRTKKKKKGTTGLFFRDALTGCDGNTKCVLWNSLVLGEQKGADEPRQAQAWGQPLKSKSQTYQECIEILLILLEPQGLDFNS